MSNVWDGNMYVLNSLNFTPAREHIPPPLLVLVTTVFGDWTLLDVLDLARDNMVVTVKDYVSKRFIFLRSTYIIV
jgi:hypothetical protein